MVRSRRQGQSNPILMVGGFATALFVLFVGLPLLALLLRALGNDGFFASLTSDVALQALKLSAFTSAVSMAVILVLGTPFAYLLARRQTLPLHIVDTLVELPIVLPPVVAGVAMLMAFGRNGIFGAALAHLGIALPFTTAAVILAQVFVSAPFYVRAAKLGFLGVDQEYEAISQTLGISPWRTFWRLTLPLSWPSLLSGAALAWARALSEFGATIMFAGNFTGRTQTMPLAILSAMESNLATALALAVMLMALSVLLLIAIALVSRAAPWEQRR